MVACIPSSGPDTLKLELPDDGVYLYYLTVHAKSTISNRIGGLLFGQKGYFSSARQIHLPFRRAAD